MRLEPQPKSLLPRSIVGYLMLSGLMAACITGLRLCLLHAENEGWLNIWVSNAIFALGIFLLFVLIFGALLQQMAKVYQYLQLAQLGSQHTLEMQLFCDEQGRILKINPQLVKETGYTESELLSMTFFDLESLNAKERWSQIWSNPTQEKTQQESTWRHKSGRQLPVEIMACILQKDRKSYFYAQARNLTESKNKALAVETELKTAQTTNQLKGQFLVSMSQNIRTPMSDILGMTEILLNSELTLEQRRYIEMAQNSGFALLNTINNILDFSKIEAGELELDRIVFQLRECVSETLYPFSQQAQEKGIELLYQIRPSVPNALIGDPTRLRQIMSNLIRNALQYTTDGEIVIGIEVNAQGETGNGYQAIELHGWVSDTGEGMSEAHQNSIFEPYLSEDAKWGSGLGLTITRRLIEMMDGRVWAKSELGHGTTIHFTFIMDVDHNTQFGPQPLELEKLVGLRTLIVDDSETNQAILSESLTAWQMCPMVARNPNEALKKLQLAVVSGTPIELVLLDAHMPGGNGFELAEEIKTDNRIRDTKIILLANAGNAGDAVQCRQLGIEGYLTKPIGQHELLAAIRAVLAAPDKTENRPAQQTLLTRHRLRETQPKLSILLAEDNTINQVVALHILQQAGHIVTLANNGAEALEKLIDHAYDVILMDIHMPEMDGFEATARIREAGNAIPIIALTTNATKSERAKCRSARMNGYIAKPLQRQELLTTVQAFAPSQQSTVQREISDGPDEQSDGK